MCVTHDRRTHLVQEPFSLMPALAHRVYNKKSTQPSWSLSNRSWNCCIRRRNNSMESFQIHCHEHCLFYDQPFWVVTPSYTCDVSWTAWFRFEWKSKLQSRGIWIFNLINTNCTRDALHLKKIVRQGIKREENDFRVHRNFEKMHWNSGKFQ